MLQVNNRTDLPGPGHRLGPRPLLLHLMLAMPPSSNWPLVWQNWSAFSPQQAGQKAGHSPIANTADLDNLPPDLHPDLLPDAELIAGIAAYRRHPFTRAVPEPPVIWAEGGSRLLDYGQAGGVPTAFVPSLVNRAHVLDLLEDHSMLRFLAASGVRPLLLDWGMPDDLERDFTLTDYTAGRLIRALASLRQPVTLAGYCMGGLMAVAAAQLRPDLITRLVLLATPWDFASFNTLKPGIAALLPMLEPMLAFGGALPVDALQMMFSLLEPGSVGAKYRDFGRQDQTSERARRFVAMEDWLNDGVPLAAPVAREVLGGWYGRNTPAAGLWRIAGQTVQPEHLHLPVFLAIPTRDRIVPPHSAQALADMWPRACVIHPAAGHVGMIAGARARREVWEPLVKFLLA